MSVTMSDIARDLKVSVVTVSKVLRNDGKISAATRKRVLRRAKELNYQMNWVARSLVTRRTYTIGLLLPNFTHPFFAEIAKTVAETVRPHGYHVIISYFDEDPELEARETDTFLARRVDGLIIASAQSPNHLEVFEQIQQRKVPYVLIDRPIAGVNASFVGVDNQVIGRMATEHLITQGCRRIAHLHGPGIGNALGRLEGYRQALAKHGMRVQSSYIVKGGYGDNTGYEGMRQLLLRQPPPDGVFCYNDPVAIGAIKAIREAGFDVPGDIAVVGAGNVHYSDLLAVPLSTVDQGTSQIGRRAAELLIQRITSKRATRPRKIIISAKLVVRESSQRRQSEKLARNKAGTSTPLSLVASANRA
jgi:LacI family transcriptional regulator